MERFEATAIWRMQNVDKSQWEIAAVTSTELLVARIDAKTASRYLRARETDAARADGLLSEIISQRKFEKLLRFDRPSISGFGTVSGSRTLCVENPDRRYFVGTFTDTATMTGVADVLGPALLPNAHVSTENLPALTRGMWVRSFEKFLVALIPTAVLAFAGFTVDNSDTSVRRGRWLVDLVDQIPDGLALVGSATSFAVGVVLTVRTLQTGYELQVARPVHSTASTAAPTTTASVAPTQSATTASAPIVF